MSHCLIHCVIRSTVLTHEKENREGLNKPKIILFSLSNFRRNSENIGLKSAGISAMFVNNLGSGSIATSREKHLNIVRAIDEDNDEELRALCVSAEYLTVAAEFTIEAQSPAKLMKIMEMAT